MSTSCGFFNSLNRDRMYNASHFGRCFDGIILSGILASIGDCFVVKAATGMTVNVGSGKSWYLGSWLENDADLPVPIEQSDVVLSRIDAVVMEFNSTETVRWNYIHVVKGEPSSTPAKPALVNTKAVVQVPLAYISVGPNVSSIVQADITNCVGTSESPFATGVMSTISTDELVKQWRDQWNQWFANTTAESEADIAEQQEMFTAWFDTVKETLDGDTAGQLLNMINAMKSVIVTLPANDWNGTEEYVQTVQVPGITSDWKAGAPTLETTGDKETDLLRQEAWSCVSRIDTGSGIMIFTCYQDKPESDIVVCIPGALV